MKTLKTLFATKIEKYILNISFVHKMQKKQDRSCLIHDSSTTKQLRVIIYLFGYSTHCDSLILAQKIITYR